MSELQTDRFAGLPLSDDKQRVIDLYDGSLNAPDRIHYPDREPNNFLIETLLARKAMGGYIALVDGAFDVPHPAHEWYLRHCRALTAERSLVERRIVPTDNNLRQAIASEQTVLVTTIDADAKVAAKKEHSKAKGNAPRPIYPWSARANRIAGLTFQTANGEYRPVIDYVTVEGDPDHRYTPFESSLTLARELSEHGALDSLIIYGEHEATITEALDRGINPLVIPDTHTYEVNPQTGHSWSSSDIIRRAQGMLICKQTITRP